MDSNKLIQLYTKQVRDEQVVPFVEEVGFSVIRSYPENSPYYKDGKKMFLKFGVLPDESVFYSVDMTNPKQRGESISYIITDGNEYKRKVTNFMSDKNEPFKFNTEIKKIIHTKTNRPFSLNEFINLLEKNHLLDRLFWRRIKNKSAEMLLRTIFWFIDKHYDRLSVSISGNVFKNKTEDENTKKK